MAEKLISGMSVETLLAYVKVIDYLTIEINNGIKRYDNSIAEDSVDEVTKIREFAEQKLKIMSELEKRIRELK